MSYMVFVKGMSAPKVLYGTEVEARTEAERLSLFSEGREIFVLSVVDVLMPTRRHRWRSEIDGGSNEGPQ